MFSPPRVVCSMQALGEAGCALRGLGRETPGGERPGASRTPSSAARGDSGGDGAKGSPGWTKGKGAEGPCVELPPRGIRGFKASRAAGPLRAGSEHEGGTLGTEASPGGGTRPPPRAPGRGAPPAPKARAPLARAQTGWPLRGSWHPVLTNPRVIPALKHPSPKQKTKKKNLGQALRK